MASSLLSRWLAEVSDPASNIVKVRSQISVRKKDHNLRLETDGSSFRNSKLTYVLQDSLGGHSKVLMFVQASPAGSNTSETRCSLDFAARARNVELGQAKQNSTRYGDAGDGGRTAKH